MFIVTFLFLYVLEKFWCQLPENGEIIPLSPVGYEKNSERKVQNRVFVGNM